MTLSQGSPAPDFTLTNTEFKPVSLSDFTGRTVLLLFFPQAFSPVCSGELCAVRDDMARFNNTNTQVLGISVDSPSTLAAFKQKHELNFPLLSDFNKEVSQAYGTLYDEYFGMRGVSKRSAFVVDHNGKIAFAQVLDDDQQFPDFAAVDRVLSGQEVLL